MESKIKICIIDDSLPIQGQMENFDDTKLISSDILEKIIVSKIPWPDEKYLQSLLQSLLNSEYYKSGHIILKWALDPNIFINEFKDKKFTPDLIIYDWEFKHNRANPATTLFNLLKLLPKVFFFVYSNKASEIPILLFKEDLDKYANRFQLLPKGDHEMIMSAEEIIYEYAVLKIRSRPVIKIGNQEILFNKSGHLKDYRDILNLEYIIGKETLKKELKKVKNIISIKSVSEILRDVDYKIFISSNKKLLISEDKDFFKKKYGPLKSISYSEVFNRYGLEALSNVLNDGSYTIKP